MTKFKELREYANAFSEPIMISAILNLFIIFATRLGSAFWAGLALITAYNLLKCYWYWEYSEFASSLKFGDPISITFNDGKLSCVVVSGPASFFRRIKTAWKVFTSYK